ncbi:MAG TPA: hypothetical protein VM901_08800 [Bdellovibrionota bacterium]|nr:hypothetical protein [Bdellovibrionota bacterium]
MASDAKKILSFYQNGKLVKKLNQEDLKSLVGEVQLKTIEPHDKSAVTYIGVPFNKVLSAVYGDGWTNTKKIKFTCLDGYNPPIDHNMFFKHEAFLVYAKAGTKDFTLKKDNETGKIVELGPYYLTWDALKATVLNNTNNRPYQLTAIDVQL